jgi:hypothetical protein
MIRADRLESLASPAFIAALAVLVVNDFALKPLFHDAVTGKLSDFAGLFALTLFVATLWPQHRRLAACVIAVSFTFWKTTYAEPLIEGWNAVAPFAFGRTVDLTDLVALPMIPLAAWATPRLQPLRLPRVLQVGLAVLAPLAFTATSQPRQLVRSTLDVSSAAVDESTLQTFFDEVAEEHGLRCSACDPLADGRVYLPADSRGKGAGALTVNLDAEQGRLFYMTSGVGRQRNLDDVLELSADIRSGLQERFPGVTAIEFESAPGRSLGRNITTFTIQVSTEGALSVETVEQARRTLSAIVEDVVRTHGLRVEADAPLYYAGGRYGTSDYDRDLTLESYSSRNTMLMVRVMRQTDNYAELHEAINEDLTERLGAAFGAAAVIREDHGLD